MTPYELRVKVVHPYGYKPDGCEEAAATRLFSDKRNRRIAVELLYDNGAIDWIPLEELGHEGYYEITNE